MVKNLGTHIIVKDPNGNADTEIPLSDINNIDDINKWKNHISVKSWCTDTQVQEYLNMALEHLAKSK